MIMEALQELVGETVDPNKPLFGQGLDSLAAIELRQKLQVRLCFSAKSLSVALDSFAVSPPKKVQTTSGFLR